MPIKENLQVGNHSQDLCTLLANFFKIYVSESKTSKSVFGPLCAFDWKSQLSCFSVLRAIDAQSVARAGISMVCGVAALNGYTQKEHSKINETISLTVCAASDALLIKVLIFAKNRLV